MCEYSTKCFIEFFILDNFLYLFAEINNNVTWQSVVDKKLIIFEGFNETNADVVQGKLIKIKENI